MAIDVERLQNASMQLADAIVDPSRWAFLLQEVATAAGAMGAGLLPLTGSGGALATASLSECLESYVREGWPEEDRGTRRRAIKLQMRGEVALDRDLTAADGDGAAFFNDFLPRFGGKWWAGVGFRSGPDLWSLTLHRSAVQDQFGQAERTILRRFSLRLNEVGDLAYVAGDSALCLAANSFDQIGKAVVAISETGRLIHANAAAERLMGSALSVARGRLILSDRKAAAEYRKVIERLRVTREGKTLCAAPIVVRARDASPLVIRILPIDGAAKSPLYHARALLLLEEMGSPARSDLQIFSRAFGFTLAEARLATQLASGETLEGAAVALGIARETARNRVKSVFQKTGTHRQAELVTLLTSLA